MAIVRTMVLPVMFSDGRPMAIHGDQSWLQQYFFSGSEGLCGYWSKQSDGEAILVGSVRDWVVVDHHVDVNLLDRPGTVAWVVEQAQASGVDLDDVDLVVVLVAAPDDLPSDGGSCGVEVDGRVLPAVAMRLGDRFDFVAHELGHALGLQHSFGDRNFRVEYAQPGEYGHPYCVMSAMSYGGVPGGGPFQPDDASPDRPGRTCLGPSLNAGTALGRGWLDAHRWSATDGPVVVELRSRHWLGRSGSLAPQALEIRDSDGATVVVEYRENALWDRAQAGPLIIFNQVKNSSADAANPGTHSATFLDAFGLPVVAGSGGRVGGVYSGRGFALQVVDRSRDRQTVSVKVVPGRLEVAPVAFSCAVRDVQETVVAVGTTTFAPGEVVCAEGTHEYRYVERVQEIVAEIDHPAAVGPVTVEWSLGWFPLKDQSGVQGVPYRTIHRATADLSEDTRTGTVQLEYRIEPTSTGSRLVARNRPEDERYVLTVSATLSTAVAQVKLQEEVQIEGRAYDYGPEFERRRWECLTHIGDEDIPREMVVVDAAHVHGPGGENFVLGEDLLRSLSLLHQRNQAHYRQALTEIGRQTGIFEDRLRVVDPSARFSTHVQLNLPTDG